MESTFEAPGAGAMEFKARVFKVLGDSNRIRILEFLRDGEKCQCEIIPMLGQTQPTVSRHLSLLEEAGLIQSRRGGNRIFYKTVDRRVYGIIDALDTELIGVLSHGLMSRLIPV